jgi:hypothetical protein
MTTHPYPRPADYPDEVLRCAIALIRHVVADPEPESAPLPCTPEAVARLNYERGRQSVLRQIVNTQNTRNREAKEDDHGQTLQPA